MRMTTPDTHAETFTPAERAYIRSELGPLLHDASDRRRRADAEDLEDRTARWPAETGTRSTEPP
jgi:hypothetical protein